MTAAQSDLIVGVDAGTSVIKAVAFTLDGRQVACAATPNRYATGPGGKATQSLSQTWSDCAATLRSLAGKIENLAQRVAAIAVTGQGDGTWLVGADDVPVDDAWIWLDARAAETVKRLRAQSSDRKRFEATGTGLAACQQGAQMVYMSETCPDLLRRSEVSLHCKDWLYLKLTGVRCTDPSEATFTFGNFKTRQYDQTVIDTLGLTQWRHLLPEIVDGSETTHRLTDAAASETGFLAGTPVALGFVDIVSTGLGAGIYTRNSLSACSVIGSTGMHMCARYADNVVLNNDNTGYVIPLPVANLVAQIQSNMAATLNIDWILSVASDLIKETGFDIKHADLVARIDGWLGAGRPAHLLYHPYVSEAGERGPFVNSHARAGLIGLSGRDRFADILRAVIEGLGMAARDCYEAMGDVPAEVRLTGGAVKSKSLRHILAATLGSTVRVSESAEAGAAGAAMVAAVAVGAFATMDDCIDQWVVPRLGPCESADRDLSQLYSPVFSVYKQARGVLEPVWDTMAMVSSSAASSGQMSMNEKRRA